MAAVVALAGCRLNFDPIDNSLTGDGDGGLIDTPDGTPAPPPTFVQSIDVQTPASTMGQLTMPATRAGTLIVVVTVNIDGSTGMVSNVTNDAGDTFISAGVTWSCNTLSIGEIWYAANGIGGATQLTVTQAAAARREIWVVETSGVRTANPLVGTQALNDVPQSTTATSPAVTPTAIPAFLIATMNLTATITGFDSSTGFVELTNLNGDEIAYAIGTTAGPYSARWNTTAAAGSYCTATVAFAAGT